MWNFISLWEATRAKKLFIIYPVTRAYSNCWIYSITLVSRRICHVPLPVSPQSLSYFCNQSLTWVSLSISQDFVKVRTWQSYVSYSGTWRSNSGYLLPISPSGSTSKKFLYKISVRIFFYYYYSTFSRLFESYQRQWRKLLFLSCK